MASQRQSNIEFSRAGCHIDVTLCLDTVPLLESGSAVRETMLGATKAKCDVRVKTPQDQRNPVQYRLLEVESSCSPRWDWKGQQGSRNRDVDYSAICLDICHE